MNRLTTKNAITLRTLLAILDPAADLFVVQRLDPAKNANLSEAVADGKAAELLASHCVEVYGEATVEKIAVDVNEWPELPSPVLLITIGRGRE